MKDKVGTGHDSYEILVKIWPKLLEGIILKRKRVVATIAADDPLRWPIDLLGPLASAPNETLHTQALAYLLNPSAGHGLGKKVLGSVLERIESREAPRVRGIVAGSRADIRVIPEYRARLDGSDRSGLRLDVRIEVKSSVGAALIVIENKIGAPLGDRQLHWYQKEAKTWCRDNRAIPLLVVLAPETRDRVWAHLSYLGLASALRSVWGKTKPSPVRDWLGLYIATIMRKIEDVDIGRLDNSSYEKLRAYLGKPRT